MGFNEELIHKRRCPTCDGDKTVPVQQINPDGNSELVDKTCPECLGDGQIIVNTEWR